MSKRTRIGRKIDAQRLAALVQRPGVDPRVWISLCVVDKVHIEGTKGPEGSGGVFADVHIMATATVDDEGNIVAQTETVRVAPAYAGNGFGFFFPPKEGDEVLVAWADGDPDHGGLLISRAWSASDPPPDLAINNPSDAVLVIEQGKALRIATQGDQAASIVVDGSNGSVQIADAGGASVSLDGKGNATVTAAKPNGTVQVTATPVTGTVKLGPVGSLAVLVQGATDGIFGVPILQAVAAQLTIVKAG